MKMKYLQITKQVFSLLMQFLLLRLQKLQQIVSLYADLARPIFRDISFTVKYEFNKAVLLIKSLASDGFFSLRSFIRRSVKTISDCVSQTSGRFKYEINRDCRVLFQVSKKFFVLYLTTSLLLGFEIVAAQEIKGAIPVAAVTAAEAKPIIPATVSISDSDVLSLAVGKSRAYKFKRAVNRISVGDPSVADVMIVNPQEVYFLGKKTGSTNVTLWHSNNQTTTIDLFVGGDTDYVKDLVRILLPEENGVKVTAAGNAIVLSGKVSDADAAHKVVRIAEEASGKKVLNMMGTNDLDQVLLEVKVAEIDKSVADNLGLQVQGSNFSFNLLQAGPLGFAGSTAAAAVGAGAGATNLFTQANFSNGLVKILAEPNIMAISGQEGQFLSGGTVYLPVPQSGVGGTVITLQAVPYGIGVKFTPTVLGGGKINLKVAPQVSQVSPTGVTVTAAGSTQVIPQILSRSASTTVQLYDGQSFAIGGLISNNVNEVISAFPWLANIPILGVLFRSSSFQNNRSELLIVVTPRIVQPLNSRPVLPTDNYIQPTASEFFLEGKLEGTKKPAPEVISKENLNAK